MRPLTDEEHILFERSGGTIKWLLAIQSMNGPLDRVVVAAEVPINNCVI